MATKKWKDVRREGTLQQESENRQWVEAQILDLNLRAMRELVGKTQNGVADAIQMGQGEVSEFERRQDHLVSKLRRYVEALGGELEVVARFDDKTIRLRGV